MCRKIATRDQQSSFDDNHFVHEYGSFDQRLSLPCDKLQLLPHYRGTTNEGNRIKLPFIKKLKYESFLSFLNILLQKPQISNNVIKLYYQITIDINLQQHFCCLGSDLKINLIILQSTLLFFVCLQLNITIILMLFQDEIPEDKGLFTFYREQAQKQDEIKRAKKLKRELKQNSLVNSISIFETQNMLKLQLPIKPQAPQRVISLKQNIIKVKSSLPKQRLIESIVDMGKQIDTQKQIYLDRQTGILKLKEPSFVFKTRKYNQKIQEINQSMDNDLTPFSDSTIPDEMRIESFHTRNRSDQLTASNAKPAIHSTRGSVVQLPDIRRSEDKLVYKPKKSIKSKLIQEAMRTKDRDKIRNIREYMKVRPAPEQIEEEYDAKDQFNLDSKSFEVFQMHQQKLMGILRKFRKHI